MKNKKKPDKPRPSGIKFVTEYVNRRTGKVMRASDYGYKAWPFGRKK